MVVDDLPASPVAAIAEALGFEDDSTCAPREPLRAVRLHASRVVAWRSQARRHGMSERNVVEAAEVEIYRDANETERLLHDQELGVPGDPSSSAVIWWPRAERGQTDREWVGTRSCAARLCPDRRGGFRGRAAFAWRHGTDVDAYDRLVGVHVLGETYPGLNSYPDQTAATLPGGTVGPDGRLVRYVGLNRRGGIEITLPGGVTARWNGTPFWGHTRALVRGVHELELAAAPGTVITPLPICATP